MLRHDVPAKSTGRLLDSLITPAPRQLPATVPNFACRAVESAVLTAALAEAGPGERARVMTITGVAGVGKTTLAVHWAHQVARCFPDGQLYVNLRGFDPSGPPVAAADAIRGFLAALSVPADMIPAAAEAQAGLYRSLLADKRMLVVLDNARDPAQVRPLLPGSAGCMVVVTSRTWLTGLVASEGARQLSLDVLDDAEAAELLTGRLGRRRTTAEPQALAELIRLCAGLPVALVIVAARAIAQQHLPLDSLATELRAARNRLDALATGDSATDVRSVFSWSYLSLSAQAARMFRLVALHPGPVLSSEAAASLAGQPLPVTERALRELVGARLVDEPAPGRFTLHDLLREYAAERVKSTGTQASRRAALHRMLDHYLQTALAARSLIEPEQPTIEPVLSTRGVTLGRLADRREAASWFEADHPVLMAAIKLAADLCFDRQAGQLSVALTGLLDRSARWEDLAACNSIALAAAQRAGDREAGAFALRGLGGAYARLGRYDHAHVQLQRCLQQFTELGNIDGQARAHLNLACLVHYMGDSERARTHAHRARELFELPGQQRAGLAAALNTVGWFEAALGDREAGLAYCQRGLALAQELDNQVVAAATWDSLGFVRHLQGHYEAAVSCYQQAVALYADLGSVWNRADVLINLGETHLAAGALRVARDLWQEALEVFEQTHHPDTGQLRARLAGIS